MIKNERRKAQVAGQLRHVLTAGGVALVSLGVLTEGEAGQIVDAVVAIAGAASVLVGFVMSWRAK
jgi:hypothetical protein